MNKYEYAIEKTYPLPATERQLNIMGNEGWELAALITIQEEGNITETYFYHFRRLCNKFA